jgi:hypothetical protein
MENDIFEIGGNTNGAVTTALGVGRLLLVAAAAGLLAPSDRPLCCPLDHVERVEAFETGPWCFICGVANSSIR